MPKQAAPARLYRARNALNSSAAASMPFGRYSTSILSFGEWMFESGSAKPVRIVGMPFVGQGRDDRQRPARADQQRTHAERSLERVQAELDRLRRLVDEAGRARRPDTRR